MFPVNYFQQLSSDMHTFQTKTKRSRSQANEKSFNLGEKSFDKSNHRFAHEHTSKRCQCCQSKNKKYPDYLQELRYKRVQKEKARLAEGMMISKIAFKQSNKLSHDIMSDNSPEDQKFFAHLSNKISQYDSTPEKSILQQFHQSIIKSHLKSSLRSSKKRDDIDQVSFIQENNEENVFKFVVSLERENTGQIYSRNFSNNQFASFAIQALEEILSQNM